MVDKKPVFKVKWHGENINCPRSSGNIRKILSKGEIVEADEDLIRRCMLYFTPIPDETSDNILVCDTVEAAVMRKVIKLLEIGEIECTWEELEKIARALKVLSVRPYDVAEGESRVEISIVPHWCHTSRLEDITVYVKDFSTRVNRELLVEMSGQFEDLLKNHHGDTLRVPSATDGTLRWILDTIHLREIIVSTHRELLFSEFEEYCFCLEDFRIRQPSSKRNRSPSSERVRPPSSERVRPPSSERVRPPSTEQSGQQSGQQVSASIDLDEQETRLPLVGECSTKAGTEDKAEPSSVKEELSAKSAGSSPKSVGPSPKSHSQSPKGASPTPKKD